MAINSFPYTITENVLDTETKTPLDEILIAVRNMPHKFSFSRVTTSAAPIVQLSEQVSTYLVATDAATTIDIKMQDREDSCAIIQLLVNNNSSFSFKPTIKWEQSVEFNTKNLFWFELMTYNGGASWYGHFKGKFEYDNDFPEFSGYPANDLYPRDDLFPANH